jgi:hypothetical protein
MGAMSMFATDTQGMGLLENNGASGQRDNQALCR